MNVHNCYNCDKRHETFTYDYCDATQQLIAKIGCCKDHQDSPDYVAPEVVVDNGNISYDGC